MIEIAYKTELEKALMREFSDTHINYSDRVYYEEIFLSGFMAKIYDEGNLYDEYFIDKLVSYFCQHKTFQSIDKQIIKKIIKEIIANPNSKDEIRYENELADRQYGLFGMSTPLFERIIKYNNYEIAHKLYPIYSSDIFKNIKAIKSIKNEINNIIFTKSFQEKIIIIYHTMNQESLPEIHIMKNKIGYFTNIKSVEIDNISKNNLTAYENIVDFANLNNYFKSANNLAIAVFDLINKK